MLFSPIHHQFGPMADTEQCLRALGMLLCPWSWQRGGSTTILAEHLGTTFEGETFLFSAGRGGLLAVLRAMGLKQDDEVILQSYTCIAVPNAIHAAGGKAVFVDIEQQTLNMDVDEVERAITPRTRAILCQHTFGIPADTERLRALCDKHKILLIEDCAHILPDATGPAEICRDGDILLLSFGREKAISGVSGGAIISRVPTVTDALKLEWMHRAGTVPRRTILRLLLYPLVYALARPLYGLTIGKGFLKAMQMLRILVPIYLHDEKEGHMPPVFHRMPNACAFLALAQWHKLQRINDHRRLLTRFYLEEGKKRTWLRPLLGVTPDLPLQKFPLFLPNAADLRRQLRDRNIHLDDGWTGCVICPASVDMTVINYCPGSDPAAEQVASEILSLPTHLGTSIAQARKLLLECDRLLSRSPQP